MRGWKSIKHWRVRPSLPSIPHCTSPLLLQRQYSIHSFSCMFFWWWWWWWCVCMHVCVVGWLLIFASSKVVTHYLWFFHPGLILGATHLPTNHHPTPRRNDNITFWWLNTNISNNTLIGRGSVNSKRMDQVSSESVNCLQSTRLCWSDVFTGPQYQTETLHVCRYIGPVLL